MADGRSWKVTLPFQFSAPAARWTRRGDLRARLQSAIYGQGNQVPIGGESGIDKTTLVDDLASDAANTEILVLRGQC